MRLLNSKNNATPMLLVEKQADCGLKDSVYWLILNVAERFVTGNLVVWVAAFKIATVRPR
jgi:hypothetical protein